jgi:hypothetical protein
VRQDWRRGANGVFAGDLQLTGQPTEGDSVRSRFWALILRELPFPFRQIGMEVGRTIVWFDHSVARIWIGFSHSPAWYVVSAAGTVAFMLTVLLFFTFISSHDPTLGTLAVKANAYAHSPRRNLEVEGHWAAQDKWRIAHMFVDHRPPPKLPIRTLDSRLIPDEFDESAPPRRTFVSSLPREIREPEVRLDLGVPRQAEEPTRLVYGQLIRETAWDVSPEQRGPRFRRREPRLLVQAEWSGSDCEMEPPRHPLTRRVIPVPEPEWTEIPPVRDERHPDLGFQMVLLREFLPAVSEFPPQSQTTTVTAYSEFPESLIQHQRSHLLAGHSKSWFRSTTATEHRPRPEAYISRAGDLTEEPANPSDDETDSMASNLPSFAEVALRLELYAPETVVAGREQTSSLLIHNEGLRPIPLVRLDESLSDLETVTDAVPPGRIHGDAVRREAHRLQPAGDRRMELTWWPNEEGLRTHRAHVMVQMEVGTTTEVIAPVAEQPMPSIDPEPVRVPPKRLPSLAMDVQYNDRVVVDDLVEIEILLRNTGNLDLHDVRILAELPEQLKHRQGREVEFVVGDLAVQGSRRAVLRLIAQSPGYAVGRLAASAVEPTESKSKLLIDVIARPEPTEPLGVAASPQPKAPPAPVVTRTPPVNPLPRVTPCCCQKPAAFELDHGIGP